MTVKQLETWENALNIPGDQWPNRSDFKVMDPIRRKVLDVGKHRDSSSEDRFVRETIQFIEIESWRVFSYARLNHLLRMLKELSDVCVEESPKGVKSIGARYAASALLVRLSQYLLAVCHDVSRVPVSDIQSYLKNRLAFGDQDPERARGLVQSTVGWMSQALIERGIAVPREVDPSRLFQPPRFSEGLISLVQKLLVAPNEARYLPIALETDQYGSEQSTVDFRRLRSAWQTGRDLAALVKGFAVASLGVDSSLFTPLRDGPTFNPDTAQSSQRISIESSQDQTKMELEAP